MTIHSFSYSSERNGWFFDKILFREVNLCVGVSGSGKTKLLNLLFDVARTALGNVIITPGKWELVLENGEFLYVWNFASDIDENGVILVTEEKLIKKKNKPSQYEEGLVVFRREKGYAELDGKELPAYLQQSSMFSMFPAHPEIVAASTCLKQMVRRQFYGGELERAAAYGEIKEIRNTTGKTNSMTTQQILGIQTLNVRLHLLQRDHRPVFDRIVEHFRDAFPLVENIFISRLDRIDRSLIDELIVIDAASPVALVKETGVNIPYPLKHLSSGMLKVLIMLSDVLSVVDDSVYLIDEYENSLGLNAIGVLPDVIAETRGKIQYIITSHHPYIINNIDINDWMLMKRKGQSVNVTSGAQLEKRYSRSSQERFMQLINELKGDL